MQPSTHSERVHELHRGRYLPDVVYGANDGIITTFAVVAGAAGASFSAGAIIVLGLANLLADGISMGLSNFLALRSKRDFDREQRTQEEWEVEQFPEIERKEVKEILERWGVTEPHIEPVIDGITKDKKRWVDLMMLEELGIIEEEKGPPIAHGVTTFLAFLLVGGMPLIPYIFGVAPEDQFVVSIIATAVSLFVVGALRSLVTKQSWIRSGFEMLGVGAIAAIAAYGVGYAVKTALGITI
jgi:VIT1/CCC1 family predicted Fe2+/Mn2+ transporter